MAQVGAPVFVGITSGYGSSSLVAITSNGDIYAVGDNCETVVGQPGVAWHYAPGLGARQWLLMGNVLAGTVNEQSTSLSGVKGLFR